MKRIGLTLRVSENQSYPERRDCIDQRWAKLLLQLNYLPVLLPNLGSTDVEAFLNDSALDGVVLTGGNSLITPDCTPADAAPERDAFEQTLLRWATSREIPVLGICRGMQMINLHFGGNLSNLSNHVGSDHPVTFSGPLAKLGTVNVNSFHDQGIPAGNVGEGLDILARAPDGSIEAVSHTDHHILGIMWHPERSSPLTEIDRQLIREAFRCLER